MVPASKFRFCLPLLIALATPLGTLANDDYPIPPAKKNHWAWRLTAPEPPAVRDRSWAHNPIDLFILARLEEAGLRPAPAASREELIRRATFDLIGLPPTPEEIDAFVNDPSPHAWEKVIDRLLASPHYGERWGRHWLDLVRYADSNGYEHDEVRPDAWRYRDYVIRSFNADKPYDRFIKEQLAGDELYPDDPEALIATGFNLLGPDMTDAADQMQRRQNTLNDMTDTAALVFLGLTMACARCHDHKFEPIPQSDYYRLQAFFTPAAFRRDLVIASPDQRAAYETALKEYTALVKPIQDEIARLEAPYRKRLYEAKLARLDDEVRAAHRTPPAERTALQKDLVEKTTRFVTVSSQEVVKALSEPDRARYQELQRQLRQHDGKRPAPLPVAMGLTDAAPTPPRTFVLERGELSEPAEEVEPGFPIILLPDHRAVPAVIEPMGTATTGRRSALARWIAAPENPLTARVMVNRLWQHHFGRGIVATASDFGVRGAKPTHPELLDWLARELIRRGWSIKQMHRLILTSATYQQSTRASAETRAQDPDNRLFSRMNRQRLEGEIIRDSLLAVSGRLDRRMGGPGVFPPIPAEALVGFKGWTVSPDPRDHVRRSVYIFARRNLRFPFLEAFDLPDSNLSCPQRERSVTAPQALALLNAADVMAAAQALADRLEREAGSNEERIERAYRLTLGRRPTETERQAARAFLKDSPLSELCRALFNVNEFVYLE
ncbi:MAG TPA: DUF1553 domain-containing protein [Gemmataceae bacterium]|nr:DUF1553 domain-containing protein [Gemmataceae bacterium]